MLELAETATSLTIRYPLWLGLAGATVGYSIAYWLLRSAKGSKNPVQHVIAGIGGFTIVTFVCASAILDATVLDAEGARESRLLSGTRSVSWKDVMDVYAEDRRMGRKGMQPHLVLRLAALREVAMAMDGLDGTETARVVAFAKARAGK